MRTFLLSAAFLLVGVLVAVGAVFSLPGIDRKLDRTDHRQEDPDSERGDRTQEAALVPLGVEGIRERKTDDGQILFLSIPNSRAAFLRYSFDAKIVEAGYLAKNGELLQDQTRAFYSTIAHAIDRDVLSSSSSS